MRIATLIVTYNRFQNLSESIESILQGSTVPERIFVVDNGSEDGTAKHITERFPDVEVIALKKNMGPAGGAEIGQRHIYEKGFDAIWMIDDDAKAHREALKKILETFNKLIEKDKNDFLLTSVVYSDKGFSQPFYNLLLYNHAFGLTKRIDPIEYKKDYFEVNIASMCGLFIPRKVFENAGFVRGDFFGWYDDTEFVLRAQKNGFKAYAVPQSKIYHPIQYRKRVKIFGKSFTFISGKPERMYYGTRNNIIAQKEMLPWFNFYFLFLPIFIIRRGVSIIFFYENKTTFLKYMVKGIIDALKNRR
jgi:rhamnopyranosyl-N-acetylglucosaminyl-diphospho-decaprenol beta-1,3/1,4-galactofuranosyltransferase